MANYLSPFATRQFVNANGVPYSGAKLFTYVSGSTTKVTTYKDSAGSSNHANPIILNTRGEPADGSGVTYPIWTAGGAAVKYVLAPSTDTDPPGSPIDTWDNISGINDTSVTISEWIAGPNPTYVSATSFTLVGDQTSTFHIGRRLKTTNSGGTIYSSISNSAYGASTTVTVVNDSGTLDSGLSSVSYGIVSSANTSDPSGGVVGTWTPVVTCETSGTITMNTSSGVYTKIGRLVIVNFYGTVLSVSAPVGHLRISGLPFTSAVSAQNYPAIPYCAGLSGLTNEAIIGIINGGGTYANLFTFLNGTVGALSDNVQASSIIGFSASYVI